MDKFIFGSNNEDTLRGGDGNDTIVGNKGDDLFIGGFGNDRLIWNNGDGSDILEGDNGYDISVVRGAVDDGDDFELRANGHRAEFERLNLGQFSLDVNNVEQFEVKGLGGDDTLTVKDLSPTDVNKVVFDGGDGDDYLDASLSNVKIVADGGDGYDTLIGGNADDTLIGGNGDNIYTGGEGADVFVVGFDGIDVINDFNSIEGDVIQISMIEFGASSLDGFSYNSSSKELSYQGNQFAAIDAVESFSIMDDITLVE